MSRLHRDAMKQLTNDIVSGRLAPGDMLQREVDLADEMGISRGVARETIRALEERGLVSVRHGRGATVRSSEHWNTFDPDVLVAVLATSGGRRMLTDYLDCRRILEVAAAGWRRRAGDERPGRGDRRRLPWHGGGGRAAGLRRQRTALPRGRPRLPPGRDGGDRQPSARRADRADPLGLLIARYPLARPDDRQAPGAPRAPTHPGRHRGPGPRGGQGGHERPPGHRGLVPVRGDPRRGG